MSHLPPEIWFSIGQWIQDKDSQNEFGSSRVDFYRWAPSWAVKEAARLQETSLGPLASTCRYLRQTLLPLLFKQVCFSFDLKKYTEVAYENHVNQFLQRFSEETCHQVKVLHFDHATSGIPAPFRHELLVAQSMKVFQQFPNLAEVFIKQARLNLGFISYIQTLPLHRLHITDCDIQVWNNVVDNSLARSNTLRSLRFADMKTATERLRPHLRGIIQPSLSRLALDLVVLPSQEYPLMLNLTNLAIAHRGEIASQTAFQNLEKLLRAAPALLELQLNFSLQSLRVSPLLCQSLRSVTCSPRDVRSLLGGRGVKIVELEDRWNAMDGIDWVHVMDGLDGSTGKIKVLRLGRVEVSVLCRKAFVTNHLETIVTVAPELRWLELPTMETSSSQELLNFLSAAAKLSELEILSLGVPQNQLSSLGDFEEYGLRWLLDVTKSKNLRQVSFAINSAVPWVKVSEELWRRRHPGYPDQERILTRRE